MALFQGETTKWEDIQIQMGNFAERPQKSPSLEEQYISNLNSADRIVKQDFVDQLLLDTSAPEEDELASIRRARLEQLKRQDQQATVRRITKENYLDEVTEGSKSAVVVVLMDRRGGNSFLESDFRKLALEWSTETAVVKQLETITVRFYLGDIEDLVGPEFPAHLLPFAVVYAHGSCQAQLQRATMLGVQSALLAAARYTPPLAEEDEEDEVMRKEIRERRDENDYRHSKGYSSTEFARNVLRQ